MVRWWAGVLAAFGIFGSALAAPPLEDYGRLPAVEQMLLSPSGETIAYLAVENGARKLVISKVGGEAAKVINIGALRAPRIAWLGDGHVLLQTHQTTDVDPTISERVDKTVLQQTTIIDVATGELRNVFRNEKMIYPATYGYFGYGRVGGKEYAYIGGLGLAGQSTSIKAMHGQEGYLEHSHIDVYQVDLKNGAARAVAYGSERRAHYWVLSSEGAVVGHSERRDRGGDWTLFGDIDGRMPLAEATDPTIDYQLVGQGRTPGALLVFRPGDDGDWEYVEYDARRRGAPQAIFGDAPIDYTLSDPVTGLLTGAVTNEADPRTLLFDPAHQAKFDKARRAFAGEIVELVSATTDFDRMIVRTEGPGDSGTYFFIDIPGRKAQAVGWNFPTILQESVGPVSTIDYEAADGTKLQAVLTLPPGRDPKGLPLIVMPHGGPESRDYARFDWWAQAFASRGYAVLQPNFRGSTGYEIALRDAGFGQWGRKMQTDLSDGVAALAAKGLVDPKRTCIVGASYGGYAALAGVTLQQGLYRCAVSYAGVSDLSALLVWDAERLGTTSHALRYERKFLGVNSDTSGDLRALSPSRLADRADAPILLIHGKDDTTVPVVQSRIMRDALRGAGKPVEMVELSGEDHQLNNQVTRQQMLAAAVAFVEKHNPPN